MQRHRKNTALLSINIILLCFFISTQMFAQQKPDNRPVCESLFNNDNPRAIVDSVEIVPREAYDEPASEKVNHSSNTVVPEKVKIQKVKKIIVTGRQERVFVKEFKKNQ